MATLSSAITGLSTFYQDSLDPKDPEEAELSIVQLMHTLGVGGGYSQDDVTSLANVITGWTYAGRLGQLGAPGTFVFNANAHQPGAQRVMGKIYGATA